MTSDPFRPSDDREEAARASYLKKCEAQTEDHELEDDTGPSDESIRDDEERYKKLEEDFRAASTAEEQLEIETRGLANTPGGMRLAMTPPTMEDPAALEGKEKEEMLENLRRLKEEADREEDEEREQAHGAAAVERSDEEIENLERRNKDADAVGKPLGLGDNIIDRTHEETRLNGMPHIAEKVPPKGEDPRTVTQEDRREENNAPTDEFLAMGKAQKEQAEQAAKIAEKENDKGVGRENSKNRQKAVDAKSRMLGIGISVAGALVFAVFLGFQFFGGGEKKQAPDPAVDETQEMMKEMRKVAPSDLRSLKERNKQTDQQNYDMPGEAKPEPTKEGSDKPTFGPTRNAGGGERHATGGGTSKNFEKDRDIIKQYENIDPAAAAAGGTEGGNSLRYRPRPFAAGSTGDTKGGVYYTSRTEAKGGGDTGALPLHDVQVRSRLKFSIRSSASNQITAVSDVDLDGLPAGAIFYGSGNFSNKRTYVQFNKVRSGDREYSIKAYAVSGKDPGIASEVIEIEDNAKITFTSGVTDAAGKVLDNLASTATGGATSGIVNGTAGEVKDKNEQERARYEYRVGAGTGFIIYIE